MHDRDQKHVVMVDERSIVLQLCCHHGRGSSTAAVAEQKVDLVTRLDVIKSAIMSKTRHGSSKVAQF